MKKPKKRVPDNSKPWWDDDLEHMRKAKYNCLKMWRLEQTTESHNRYKETRNKFKKMYKDKQNNYRQHLKEKFSNAKYMNDMWKYVKAFRETKSCINAITTDEWNTYFENLLNTQNELDEVHNDHVTEYINWHKENCEECENGGNDTLNHYVTIEEVHEAIVNLANKKSPGTDGIVNEILKDGKTILVPLITRLFNSILYSGIYPDEWCKAIIVPIHKGGDVNNTTNYRGISLLPNLGKLFCKLINKRLIKWADDNNHMCEQQAGFTKGKSTIDQIFILQSVIGKYLKKKKGRCYTIFVDFAKAFDRVPHNHLFYMLCTKGAHGRVLNVLQNMYTKLQSCVSNGYNLSDFFNCSVGTRQGCMISPFLFIFYLNELVRTCAELPGIYINENHKNLNMLLYADDLVIIGDQVGRIQKLLDALGLFCKKWGLSVNMNKTKAMVYRNGGIIRKNEKFYFDNSQIENVSYYKYLGVLISTRLSWTPAQKYLSAQADRACYSLKDIIYNCDYSFTIANKLFDTCVMPILNYGSEIFATNIHECIEAVKIRYYKRLLGVGRNTSNEGVRGECGQYRVYMTCVMKCIKYWFRLLHEDNGTLLKSCYDMLYKSCENGKSNWASGIKKLLSVYGFYEVWMNQGTPNVKLFLHNFELRLKDCEKQSWRTEIASAPKLYYYCMYKNDFEIETYLLTNLPRKVKKQYSRFRLANHDLQVEKGRHENMIREERLCAFCIRNSKSKVIECEYHLCLECPLYEYVRKQFPNVSFQKNIFNFIRIMSKKDENNALAWCVWKCFKLRTNYMDGKPV